MVETIEELSCEMSVSDACNAMGLPRSTFYRLTSYPFKKSSGESGSTQESSRGLDKEEQEQVRAILNSERFVDCSPYVVYATLLDEGIYLCSISTMYRILRANGEVRERRNQRKLPSYRKPELLATKPNMLWSWDISWIKGPVPGKYYYIYVILDVFSRYIVAWTIAEVESADLAQELIDFACQKQDIQSGDLTLHSDRGPAMRSIPVAHLLEQLGVAKSHSRPYVSDDNPYSEAQFKTMKYRSDYPNRFDSIDQARSWTRNFIQWYNFEHLHSGIGLITPAALHVGQAQQIFEQRQLTLDAAYQNHPERFINGKPQPPAIPTAVWINKPPNNQHMN